MRSNLHPAFNITLNHRAVPAELASLFNHDVVAFKHYLVAFWTSV